jgi:hypothetical protein
MGWRMLVKPYASAEMTGAPTVTQRFKVTAGEPDRLLYGVALGAILYGDPAFGVLTAELWSDRDGDAVRLLSVSTNSYAKAALLTTGTFAHKIIGFSFSTPYPLKAGTYYHIALRASSYTGSSTSFVGSRLSYPDPQYRNGVTLSVPKAAKYPFDIGFMTVRA